MYWQRPKQIHKSVIKINATILNDIQPIKAYMSLFKYAVKNTDDIMRWNTPFFIVSIIFMHKYFHMSQHLLMIYRKTSYISRTLVCNKTVDHSDVVGASPVGAAPTTSS